MRESQYQYAHNIKLNLENAAGEKMILSDVSNKFMDEETEITGPETTYKETKIYKNDILEAFNNEKIEIKDKDRNIVLLNVGKSDIEGLDALEDGAIISTIETAENIEIANIVNHLDNITIDYLSDTHNLDITVSGLLNNQNSEKKQIYIENKKEVSIIEEETLQAITKLDTEVLYEEYGLNTDTEPSIQKTMIVKTEVKERETKAELGINLSELSTTQVNNVQFTITLFTDSYMYDLYKNPQFKIALPECVKTINEIDAGDITLLNNSILNEQENEEEIFSNVQLSQEEENNRKLIIVSLSGEQIEHVDSSIKNVQVVIPAKIETSKILPTTETTVDMYYSNANATTYSKESITSPSYGEYNKNIKFVAATGILSKTTINLNGKTVEYYRGETEPIITPSKANNNGIIRTTIVNNTGAVLQNCKILGRSELLQEIVTDNAVSIKYSPDIEATIGDEGWTTEYSNGMKSYLIELENIENAASIEFGHNITVPEVENDTEFIEHYEILTNENEKISEGTGLIQVKTIHLKVELEASVGENKAIYKGQEFSYNIRITNEGETTVKGISITNTLPENVELVDNTSQTSWANLELDAGEKIQKRIVVKANDTIIDGTIIEDQVEVNAQYLLDSIRKTTANTIKTSDIEVNISEEISKSNVITDKIEVNSELEYILSLKNKTSEEKTVTVIAELPQNINNEGIYVDIENIDLETEEWEIDEGNQIIFEENTVTITIQMEANQSTEIILRAFVDKFISKEVKAKIQVKYDEEDIVLEIVQDAITLPDISIESNTYKNNIKIEDEDIELNTEDELLYEIKIKNNGETTETLDILAEISELIDVKSIVFIKGDDSSINWEEEDLSNIFSVSGENLGENEQAILSVVAKFPENLNETRDLVSAFMINGSYMDEIKIPIKHRVLVQETMPVNPGDTENPDNPDDPTTPEHPYNSGDSDDSTTIGEKKFSISGIAWLDENEDGKKDTNEQRLSGIKVNLVKDNDIEKETVTDKDGKYSFQELLAGEYIVMFEFDQSNYKITDPKKEGVGESINSDAYEISVDGENLIRTDKLSLNSNLEHVDIGLIEKEIFDLKIIKEISKITISNEEGTKVINYKNENFAKIELPAKQYLDTSLIIEYSIKVQNIGEVTGYVYGLEDIIPEGTEFISELNPDWYEHDGKLYSIALTEEAIKPSETKELKVIITKQIDEEESISIKNIANITETFNSELLLEKNLDNNTSQAEILISIKTGSTRTYIILAIAALTIIAIGSYVIKKKVLI